MYIYTTHMYLGPIGTCTYTDYAKGTVYYDMNFPCNQHLSGHRQNYDLVFLFVLHSGNTLNKTC
jgi:hypothetical protein